MGNYRFRLADMIPNAWFYKLKDFTTSSTKNHCKIHPNKKFPSPPPAQSQKQHQPNQPSPVEEPQTRPCRPRKSYYCTRKFTCKRDPAAVEPPAATPLYDQARKSSTKTAPTRRKSTSSSLSSLRTPNPTSAPCRHGKVSTTAVLHSHPSSPSADTSELDPFHDPQFCPHDHPIPLPSKHRVPTFSADEIIVKSQLPAKGSDDPNVSGISTLAPIIAKPENFKELNTMGSAIPTGNKEQRGRSMPIRVRLRVNSPKIMNSSSCHGGGGRRSSRFSGSRRRNNTSESFAVVKFSIDPQMDFKESMVEMIEENNIKGSKALEDLLACYLSLNSDEYHDVIIKVFKQIWFDLHGPIGD